MCVCVCVCVCITGRWEMVECFLLSRPGRVLGTTWGPSPHPLLAGEVPSPVPLPRPPSSPWLCGGMNQLSQLVKARPLVFMPSPQETVTAFPAPLSRGPGSSLYKHPQACENRGHGDGVRQAPRGERQKLRLKERNREEPRKTRPEQPERKPRRVRKSCAAGMAPRTPWVGQAAGTRGGWGVIYLVVSLLLQHPGVHSKCYFQAQGKTG